MIAGITLKLQEAKPLPWSTFSSYISESATHKPASRSFPPAVNAAELKTGASFFFPNLWFSSASARSSFLVMPAKDSRRQDWGTYLLLFSGAISKAGLRNSQFPLCPCVAEEDGIEAIASAQPSFSTTNLFR